MPAAPTGSKKPSFFPDLMGANEGQTPGSGWLGFESIPYIGQVGLAVLVGTGLAIVAGALAYFYRDRIAEAYQSSSGWMRERIARHRADREVKQDKKQ